MSIRSDADLDFMLQDAGDPVTFGTQSTYGIVRTMPVLQDGDLRYVGQHVALSIRDGTLTGLVDEALITIAGVSYRVRDTGFVRANGQRTLTVVPV